MRKLLGVLLLLPLGGCGITTIENHGLPGVRHGTPLATVMLTHEAPIPGHPELNQQARRVAWMQAGWLLAYEANGHFKGYSDEEKLLAVQLRGAEKKVCEDDRDPRLRVTQGASGLNSMNKYERLKPCTAGYDDWPRPEEFGAAGVTQLVTAARTIGMTCREHSAGADCELTAPMPWLRKSESAAAPVRTLKLTLRPSGPPVMKLEGEWFGS